MKTILSRGYVLLAIVFLASCIGQTNVKESPTAGNIKIGVDESYQLMAESQIDLFESIYHYAVINAEFGPEATIIQKILDDSVRCIITNRQLNEKEVAFLTSKKIVPKTTKIAYDGVALIVNRDNPDSTLSYAQVGDIFRGKLKMWKQLDPKNSGDSLFVIFDNNASGNPRYFRETYKITGPFPANCMAVNSNEEVIRYVQENKGALGIISVNWITDKDDTIARNFRKSVKVVGIGADYDTENEGPWLKPFQAYLADGTYPFIREVYVINCETFSGLGSGFASFVAGEKGQRVVLKSGLVPATMPVRLVQVKK